MAGEMKPLSESDLARIRSGCSAATPGPWTAMVEGRDHVSGDSFIMRGEGGQRGPDLYLISEDRRVSTGDYDFIANARQDIPRLLDEIDRLRSLLKEQDTGTG
jgi:hypothetical protein